MTRRLIIAGGGIAGLAAAVAAAQARWEAQLFEQAPRFSEIGAGLQLGPNATRVLRGWGLLEAVAAQGFAPQRVCVRDARSGRELAALPLGEDIAQRYGAPYLTIHRADLHAILLKAAQAAHGRARTNARVTSWVEEGSLVRVRTQAGVAQGQALAVADGLWSSLRQQLLQDGPPRVTDHLAWRGLIPADSLPPPLRRAEVTVWLGPRSHMVSYPVRAGDFINLVCVVEGHIDGESAGWDPTAPQPGPMQAAALRMACTPLRELIEAVPAWGLWVLHDRPPLRGAGQMARGRIALLGDAAHPMPPYLAQGAAMAIEDAWALGAALGSMDDYHTDVPTALRRYALGRWRRCARVQRRSRGNGLVFHASGPLRWARDAVLGAAGAGVLDLPWLYRGGAEEEPPGKEGGGSDSMG